MDILQGACGVKCIDIERYFNTIFNKNIIVKSECDLSIRFNKNMTKDVRILGTNIIIVHNKSCNICIYITINEENFVGCILVDIIVERQSISFCKLIRIMPNTNGLLQTTL